MALVIDNIVSEGLVDLAQLRSQVNAVTVAASTQTMTNADVRIQSYTGATAGQIVKLPSALTITVGYEWLFLNDASVNISLQNSAATLQTLIGPSQRCLAICTDTGSAAGVWSISIFEKSPSGEQFKFTYPGTGLAVNYTGGNYRLNGTLTAIAAGTITLPDSTNGTIYVDIDGVVKATTSLPSSATPLYTFTTTGGAVTVLTDVREDIENNIIWGTTSDMVTVTAGQAKAAGSSEKYSRADHVHGNGNLLAKAGTVAAGSFSGSPKIYAVVFGTTFGSTNYSISIRGTDNRSFTWQSKLATGFTINSNANTALTGNVDWSIEAIGEAT
jgi:hypothetical protein